MISKKRVVIFASGSGTNAEQIVKYFKNSSTIEICAVFTNNPQAGVIDRMHKLDIPTYLFRKNEFYDSEIVENELLKLRTDFIVLAGFLWLMPLSLVKKFNNKIINIHPALLPKYGGKGMYGMNVHKAVLANKESTSGITIHLVNEEFDKGEILFQTEVNILPEDTPEILAEKIHKLEYKYFPIIIEKVVFEFCRK